MTIQCRECLQSIPLRGYLWWSSHESAISSSKKELQSVVSIAEGYCPLTHQSNLLNGDEESFSVPSISNACTNKGIRCIWTLRTGCSAPDLDKSILKSLMPRAAFGVYSKKMTCYPSKVTSLKKLTEEGGTLSLRSTRDSDKGWQHLL